MSFLGSIRKSLSSKNSNSKSFKFSSTQRSKVAGNGAGDKDQI
jgi:hypothetical protein